MRDSRFIELLNLYIDHQLSPAEAAELESEITQHPARRQTYDQYCRMQKACTVLFEQERTMAPSSRVLSSALVAAERKVVTSSRPRRSFAFPSFAGIGLAAAACFAFVVVVNRSGNVSPSSSSPQVAGAVAPAPESASVAAAAETKSDFRLASSQVPAATTVRAPRESLFASNPVRPFGTDDSPSELMLDGGMQSPVSYSWMRDVELAPVASLSDRITLQATPASFETRTLVLRHNRQSAEERSAFQFQR